MTHQQPQITADALAVIRARHLTEHTGLVDPHAHLFGGPDGERLAAMAIRVDAAYVEANLDRFARFARAMREAAAEGRQILLLGAGVDTRPLWLEDLREGRVPVFEIEFADKLAAKRHVLETAGIAWPVHLHAIGADLREPGLGERLRAAGWDPAAPTAVFAEGVLFFLPAQAVHALLDPATLDLHPGTTLLADLWTAERLERMQGAVRAAIGRTLFGDPGLAEPFADSLRSLGWRDVEESALTADGWRIVRAVR